MSIRDDVRPRACGCLVGLAVGDALGAAVEFQLPGTFAPVTGMRDGGPHRLKAGEWTDDTSMALALADSIRIAGWDLTDQARRYVDWWRNGTYSVNGRCFGPSVLAAVNLGDDADTTGAVCGQLAGANSGMESIDQDWLATLAGFDDIVAVADSLADVRL